MFPNIPKLPTDKYYKFVMFLGLSMIVGSLVLVSYNFKEELKIFDHRVSKADSLISWIQQNTFIIEADTEILMRQRKRDSVEFSKNNITIYIDKLEIDKDNINKTIDLINRTIDSDSRAEARRNGIFKFKENEIRSLDKKLEWQYKEKDIYFKTFWVYLILGFILFY